MNNTCNLCPADMTMIRGDLFEYPLRFSLNEDTAYRLLDGDVLRFGVFRGRKPMLLLRYYSTQQAEDGTIKITIAPELTERMAPGDYRFEAELTSDINGIHTVAGGTFRLMEDRITPDVRNGVVKPPDYPDSELPDDHERLNGREKSDQHPIRAVTGLSKRTPAPKSFKKVARSLKNALATPVRVKTVQGKNKIEIEFKDEADLERIYKLMTEKG